MLKLQLASAALALTIAGPLFAADDTSKNALKAEKERISTEFKANKKKCKALEGNAEDICMAEAKGQQKVAKADLAAQKDDTPKKHQALAVAKADMAYEVAKEKCDDRVGGQKSDCEKDAKAAHAMAKQQAKSNREIATKSGEVANRSSVK